MRPNTTLIAVIVVVLAVAAAPVAAASDGTATETPRDGDAVAPGEKLAGVVGVQEAEINGELDERTFGVKLAGAKTDAAKAEVVAEQIGDVEARLNELEAERERLEQARKNGSISEGRYRAEVAELAAETATVQRLTNESARVAGGLPKSVLEAQGINVSAIETLKNRAEELTGPEVAEIAQSIGGDDVGKSVAGTQGADDLPSAAEGAGGTATAGGDRGQGAGQGQGTDRPSGTGTASDGQGTDRPGANETASAGQGTERPGGTETATGGQGTETASGGQNTTETGGQGTETGGTGTETGGTGTETGGSGTETAAPGTETPTPGGPGSP